MPEVLRDVESLEFGTGIWVFVEDEAGVRWMRPQVQQSRAVPLARGFNLVTWTAGARPIGPALASLGDDVVAVYVWDPLAQRFQVHRLDGPSFLNDLDLLLPGQAMWVDVRQDTVWDQA